MVSFRALVSVLIGPCSGYALFLFNRQSAVNGKALNLVSLVFIFKNFWKNHNQAISRTLKHIFVIKMLWEGLFQRAKPNPKIIYLATFRVNNCALPCLKNWTLSNIKKFFKYSLLTRLNFLFWRKLIPQPKLMALFRSDAIILYVCQNFVVEISGSTKKLIITKFFFRRKKYSRCANLCFLFKVGIRGHYLLCWRGWWKIHDINSSGTNSIWYCNILENPKQYSF